MKRNIITKTNIVAGILIIISIALLIIGGVELFSGSNIGIKFILFGGISSFITILYMFIKNVINE